MGIKVPEVIIRMTTLCLIRHGQTDWNLNHKLQGREDVPLNKIGKKQAFLTATHLQKYNWDLIITSPLKRSTETANIISNNLNIETIYEMDEFVERDFGEASGLTKKEVKSRFFCGNDSIKFAFSESLIPNMETFDCLRNRSVYGIEEIARKYNNKKIIVVTHGAVINVILSFISNGDIGTGKTNLSNACINIIKYIENNWKVEVLNETVHLNK